MSISLVVGEDDYLVREGVRQLLGALDGIDLKAACDTYDSLIAAIQQHEPDVLLTDIRMPPTRTDEGIRIAGWARTYRPELGVVVLSQYVEAEYAIALLEHGSAGRAYLLKERLANVDQLVRAIEEVAGGGSMIDPQVVEALISARRKRSWQLDPLSARERDVLAQLAQGKSNAAAAAALFISERAVEKHTNSIFSKLGLSDETDLNRRVKAVLLYLENSGTRY